MFASRFSHHATWTAAHADPGGGGRGAGVYFASSEFLFEGVTAALTSSPLPFLCCLLPSGFGHIDGWFSGLQVAAHLWVIAF